MLSMYLEMQTTGIAQQVYARGVSAPGSCFRNTAIRAPFLWQMIGINDSWFTTGLIRFEGSNRIMSKNTVVLLLRLNEALRWMMGRQRGRRKALVNGGSKTLIQLGMLLSVGNNAAGWLVQGSIEDHWVLAELLKGCYLPMGPKVLEVQATVVAKLTTSWIWPPKTRILYPTITAD